MPPTVAREAGDRPTLGILSLPPELRNIIYRLVLLATENVPLGPRYKFPKLLQTCQQIRTETLSIFWLENTFVMITRDYNARIPKQLAVSLSNSIPSARIDFYAMLCGYTHWPNLYDWLRAYHEGKAVGPGRAPIFSHGHQGEAGVVQACFEIAKKGRDRGLKWDVVAEMLGSRYPALRSCGRPWR